MNRAVAIVDYGLGNLFNVERALRAAGAEPRFVSDAAGVEGAERLLLPGVGAFGDGMLELHKRGLVAPLRAYGASGRPLLGICLGMQMLFEAGLEFGRHEGLGLLAGTVEALAPAPGASAKLPHIGWAPLHPPSPDRWEGTLFRDLGPADCVYFVHSFAARPADAGAVLATSEYGGAPFCAAVQRGALAGCQFHAERSGPVGLRILERFVHD